MLKATRDKLVRDRVSRLLSTDNSGSEVAKVIEEGLGGEVCEFLKLKEVSDKIKQKEKVCVCVFFFLTPTTNIYIYI